MPATPLVDADMAVRFVRVPERDVVFVRGVLEASLGVAALFATHGGDLLIASSRSRSLEMDQILSDLANEVPGFSVVEPASAVADPGAMP
jgi:hypothetical protein